MSYREIKQALNRQSISDKVADARASQGLPPLHLCAWPGCNLHIKPESYTCLTHWRDLPIDIRTPIWKATPGTEAHAIATQAAQEWIARNHSPRSE